MPSQKQSFNQTSACDGEPIWSVNSQWISESEYNSNPNRYLVKDERTIDGEITGYNVPIYKRSVFQVDDYYKPIYRTYWIDGYWTYKTVKDYGWKKTSFWTYLLTILSGRRAKAEKDYSKVVGYTIYYNEFHRDWNWIWWGGWYFHKSDSFTVSPSEGSDYWKGKKWGGAWYQGWYKYCTGKKANYEYNYYTWGVTGIHQEKDEWVSGHEETDYNTIIGYEQKLVYGNWTLDRWKTVSKSQGESYNGTITYNSKTQWRYSEKRAIRKRSTEYKVRELQGYRVQSSSGVWSSESVTSTVTLTSYGYIGDVKLSIDDSSLPKGITATLAHNSRHLSTRATTTLTINFPASEKALTGTYMIEITATPQAGESQTAQFKLNVTGGKIVFEPPYDETDTNIEWDSILGEKWKPEARVDKKKRDGFQ